MEQQPASVGPLSLSKPILLWLTDRSRYETGNMCPAERMLRYHWGPNGYGIQKAAQKVPLATGDVIHRGLGHVLCWVRDHDVAPTAEVLDAAVALAHAGYQEIIATRGLLHWSEDSAQQQRLVDEQLMLVEGLVRAWSLWKLPELLKTYRVVHVEEEYVSIHDCTCGIGDRLGTLEDHVAKGCEGIGIQTRADFVAQHRVTDNYAYNEFKTVAEVNARFRETWDTTIQPYLGTLGIEDSLGIEMSEIYVHGLVKGKFDHEYDVATRGYTGPEYQNSRLVYAWMNETTPMDGEWAVRYQWTGADGVNHRLPKAFKRTPVSRFGAYQEYLELFAGDLEPQVLHTVGPLPRKDHIREDSLDSWVHEERRIRWALHELADLIDLNGGDWTAAPVKKFLNQEFPKTFDCQRFGGRYKCHFIPVCHYHPGWEDPLGLLGYVHRRPHHTPEELQAVERGCLPALTAVETYED